MPENDVLFTVDIDGKRFKLNQEQYESTKDTLYKNHPNAQVVRTGLYDAQSGDVQADAGIKVTFDNGMTADITGQQFNETKEQLYKTNPAARVEYTTNESNNYWRSRLDEDKRALQTFDEDNNAFMDEYREALRNSTQMQRGARELTPAQKFVAEHHDEYESKREMRNALGKAIIDNPLVKSGRQAASEDAKRKREEYLQNAENAETGAERRDWKRAAKLMGDAAKMYDAPSQFEENGFSDYLKNYWAGAENTFSDKDFWTRGLTQITRDIDLYGIRKRVQDAQDAKGGELTSEDYDRILSKSEKAQLMAAYNLAYSQANDEIGRAADLPSSFRAGKSAAESLGFMAEFMLGTGIMNVGGKALLKGSKSAFGKWMGEALMSTNARNAAVKEGLLPSVERSTAQEIGRSFAQSLVQGAAHTVAQPLGTLSSVTRELNETDDEGRLNSIGEAVLRGVGDTIIENWSESFGNTIDLGFGVIGNGLGKAMPKTLKTDFGKMARWAYNSQFKKVLAEAGFNGFIGEMAEEWFGNAARVATGLMSTEQFKEFASLDQQLEMAAAFGPMSLIGLAGNLRSSAASRKRYNDLAGQVKDILIENGVEQSEVDALFNKKWATNEDIAQSLSPYAKTILQGTGNTEKNYDTFLRFAEAAGAQALQEEVQAAQDENSRNALRDEISAKTGQFWRTDDSPEAKDAEGNPLQINHVRVVEGSDGARRYILSESEDGTLAYVDENGNKGFTKAGDIERGLEDGSIVSDRDVMLDEYLQERVDAIRTGEEQQRMQTEEQENLAAIQQRIQQNPTFEYGSEESPATATFEAPAEQSGLQGGMMLIRKADGTETREFWDWEQIGTALNMPLRAKTDEQIAEDEAKAQEEAEARKNQYNTIKPGAQVMIDNSAIGEEDSPAYFAKAIYEPSENFVRIYVMGEDGKIATDENGNEIFYPEDMVKGLDAAMQSAQSEAQTEATEVEEEPQAAPVEKYIQDDGSVNETLFLRDEPAEWAKWNDAQNKDGGVGTRRIINAGIQSLDKQIADAQKKLDAEANPDESRRKADALAKLTDRRNTLASIIAGYRQQEAEIAENDMPSDMLTEVPTDANGNKLYTQAPAQLTYEDIYSDENLESEEEAYDFIKGRVNAAKKDLDKVMADADKIKPENYPSTAAYGEAKRAAREAVAPYQTTYDYWKGVQDLADAEVAAQQQRAANAEARRQDALNTPQTLNELVADIFAGLRNSLNKESFKKETGYSDKDLRPFFQLFAKKGQGMGVERLAEYIAENVQPEQAHLIPTDSNGQKDISAVRDAILDVFQSVASPTDLYNYVRNSNLNREAEEQRRMEEEARQAEEQAAAEKATFEEQPSEEKATFEEQPSEEKATFEEQPSEEKATMEEQPVVAQTEPVPATSVIDKVDEVVKELAEKQAIVDAADEAWLNSTGLPQNEIHERLEKVLAAKRAMRPVESKLQDIVADATDEDLTALAKINNPYLHEAVKEAVKVRDARRRASKVSLAIAEVQPLVEAKAKPLGKLNLYTVGKKDEVRPVLNGVYHDKGYAVATDTRVLIADKEAYDKKHNGKVMHKDGKQIQGKFPDWRSLLGDLDGKVKEKIDFSALRDFIASVRAEREAEAERMIAEGNKKIKKTEYVNSSNIIINLGKDNVIAFKLGELSKFADYAERIGAKEMLVSGREPEKYPVAARASKGVAMIMPVWAEYTNRDIEGVAELAKYMADLGWRSFGQNEYQKTLELESSETEDMPDELFDSGLSDVQKSALAYVEGKTPEQVEAEVRAEKIQSYLDNIGTEDARATVSTRDNIINVLRQRGSSEFIISKVQEALDASKDGGWLVRGFRANGSIYVVADDIVNAESARTTYVHERQHGLNRRNGYLDRMVDAGVIDRDILESICRALSHTDEYDGLPLLSVMDEALSMGMEVAYSVPAEELENAFKERGVDNQEFINFVKTIDDEQRADSNLSKARFWGRGNTLRSEPSERADRQNVGATQAVSGGVRAEDVGERGRRISGLRPSASSGESAGGREESLFSQFGREDRVAEDGLDTHEGSVLFSKNDGSLVGLHNITEGQIIKSLKTGGLANPSMAVIDFDRQNHEQYGEISLVAPASLVDSRSGRNAGTFTGDVWSPTYPRVTKHMSSKGSDVFYKDIMALPEDVRNKVENAFDNYLEDDRESNALKWWFLEDTGRKPEIAHYQSQLTPEEKEQIDIINETRGEDTFRMAEALFRKYADAEAIERATTKIVPKKEAEPTADEGRLRIRRIVEKINSDIDKYGISTGSVWRFFDQLQMQAERDGKLDEYTTFDNAQKVVEDGKLDKEYNKWLRGKEDKYGVEERLFSHWTRDGYKRYVPNTVENASRLMNKEQVRNGEGGRSVSATKAILMRKLTSLEQIRQNKDRLTVMAGEDYDSDAYKAASDNWVAVASQLSDMKKIDSNPFINMDIAAARLHEALLEKNPIAYLNKEYGYNLSEDGDFAKDLKASVKEIKALPTKYFETVFRRPVYLNEFAAAVVPTDASQEVKDALSNAGLPLFEYDDKVEGSRRAATEQATDIDGVRFSKVASNQDAEYMKAVEEGDMEKAQQMVRDAFKVAFPNTVAVDEQGNPKLLYHGTHSPYFTEFARPGENLQGLIWVTDDKRYAEYYNDHGAYDYENEPEGFEGLYKLYADVENPLEIGYIEDLVGSENWNKIAALFGMTPQELGERLKASYKADVKLTDYIYDYTRGEEFVKLLKEYNYDGVLALEDGANKIPTIGLISPNQVKSADPVTYDDKGNVIPLSERFNSESDDIRFSKANATNKQPGKEYPIDIDDADVMFSLSKNNRKTIETWLGKRKDITDEQRKAVVDYLETLENPKLQLATARWFARGVVRLPEDMSKIEQAVSVAGKAKVDPLQYDSPMALLDAHANFEASEKRINPDEVNTLHKAQEFPAYGITVYDVDEGDESRQNMRQIINTHFGKEASPWCLLQGDGKGNLTKDSGFYWDEYNAYPKQVAFKDGKLLAFSANDSEERCWWDKQDRPHKGIPIIEKMKDDALGRTATYCLGEDGTLSNPEQMFKGNKQDGEYREWHDNGNLALEENRVNGVLEGPRRYYYASGELQREAVYKNGHPVGEIKEYQLSFKDGKYQSELREITRLNDNSQLEGLQERYDRAGKKVWQQEYHSGEANGDEITWYSTGEMMSRTPYKDGVKNGLAEEWSLEGVLVESTEYEDGEKHGISRTWDSKGRPIWEYRYENGKRDGVGKRWHMNGQLVEEEHHKNGLLHGVQRHWTPDGVLVAEEWDKNGALDGAYREWWSDGKPRRLTEYKEGHLNGIHIWYSASGLPRSIEHFENDRQAGVKKEYNNQGELVTMLLFKDGHAVRDLLAEGVTEEGADNIRFSKVTDAERLAKLESEPTIRAYRAMVMIDGKLYPPMSTKEPNAKGERGKKLKLREPSELGAWEQADEAPDKAYEGKDGKYYFDLKKDKGSDVSGVLYNPYIHTSMSPLNDQFSGASERPNLVTVEVEVPMSEPGSGYKAEKAADAVGFKDWHSGTVTAQLGEGRQVLLTRFAKPVRVVPDSEVAAIIAPKLKAKNVSVPYKVVTPSLRAELAKRGVNIIGEDDVLFNKNDVSLSDGQTGTEGTARTSGEDENTSPGGGDVLAQANERGVRKDNGQLADFSYWRDRYNISKGSGKGAGTADQQISLDDLERLFGDLQKDEVVADLFERALPIARQVGITAYFGEPRTKSVRGEAKYSGKVYYNTDLLTDAEERKAAANTIAHELIHEATMSTIELYRLPQYRHLLTDAQKDSAKRILKVYDKVKNIPVDKDDEVMQHRISSAVEMVAGITDPKFRQLLREYKPNGSRYNLWQRLVNALARAFAPAKARFTMEDKLSYALDYLLSDFEPAAFEAARNIAKADGFTDDFQDIRFSKANENNEIFVSNAQMAVRAIPMGKATPEQWLKMIEGKGGMKAGEDKWLGLSDWLKASDKKTITKEEIEDYINENRIQIEEDHYASDSAAAEAAMQPYVEEFNELVAHPEAAYDAADERVAEFYEEMRAKYGDDYLDKLNETEFAIEGNLLNWREEAANKDPYESAFDQMVEKYGDDFSQAFYLNGERLDYDGDMEGNPSDAARWFLDIDDKPIDSTRLAYTTEGLTNKREIALTVPTIEPWNESDQIHFGDAGEGRAVAWARFGDAQEDNKKVLFIDEIQSKRHQEGREHGYYDSRLDDADSPDLWAMMQKYGVSVPANLRSEILKKVDDASDTAHRLSNEFSQTYPKWTTKEEYEINGFQNFRLIADASVVGQDKADEYNNAMKASREGIDDVNELDRMERQARWRNSKVPAAPFEKNWHELAMKRMLRYAAENGYDVVAWTTGDQQAERYNIGNVVEDIDKRDGKVYIDLKDGSAITLTVDKSTGEIKESTGAHIESGEYNGKNLRDLIGKELEKKVLEAENGTTFRGIDLRIGGEGMRGFYDDMLPRFMNKYGKKWGVSTRDAFLTLNDGTHLEAHAVDVNDAMKESVLEGQVMFSKSARAVEEVREKGIGGVVGEDNVAEYYNDVYKSMDAEVRRGIAERSVGNGLNTRKAVEDHLSELAYRGYENDESGALLMAESILDYYAGEKLEPNAVRYMLWRGENKVNEDDLLEVAQDMAMRRSLKIGAYEEPVQFSKSALEDELVAAAANAESTVDEAKEEKDRNIDDMRRGKTLNAFRAMMQQKTYDQKTVAALADLAKQIVKEQGISDINRREIARLMGIVKASVGKSPKMVKRYADAILDLAIDNMLRSEREALADMTKMTGSRVNTSGVEVGGALDVQGQKILKAYRKASSGATYTRDNNGNKVIDISAIDEEMDSLSEALSSEDEAVRKDAEARYEGLRLAKEYLQTIQEHEDEEDALEMDIADAKRAHKEGELGKTAYEQAISELEEARLSSRIEQIEALRKHRAQVKSVIVEGKDAAKEQREAEKARVNDIRHKANSDMLGVPTDEPGKKGDWRNSGVVQFFTGPLGTFTQFMRLLGRRNAYGEGHLYNHYMPKLRNAMDNEYLGVKDAMEKVDAKVASILGEGKKFSDLIALERSLDSAARKDGKIVTAKYLYSGDMKEYELGQGQLLYIYMVNKMNDGRMKLRRMGLTEDAVEKLSEQIDPRLKEFADWAQSELLVDLRNKYNKVYERVFGAPMAAIENYFPLRIDKRDLQTSDDLSQDNEAPLPSTITGAVIKRTRNNRALDINNTDALAVLSDHINEMEHWAAFAEFIKDANTLLSYRRFHNQLTSMRTVYGTGETLWRNFRDTVKIAAGAYQFKTSPADRFWTNLARAVNTAKVNFRINTAIKQLASMTAFIPDMNMKNFAKAVSNPMATWKWCMDNLPSFQKRVGLQNAGDEKLMPTDDDYKLWRTAMMQWLTKVGLAPNKFVDGVTVSIGAKAIYDTRKERYLAEGFDEETADKKAKLDAATAFNETQQSSEGAFLSAMQRNKDFISTSFTVFRNGPFGYARKGVNSIRSLNRMLRNEEGMREAMQRQLMGEGLSESQAAEAANKRFDRAKWYHAATIATNFFINGLVWNLFGHMWYYLLGDDDDKKKEMLSEDMVRSLAAPVEGFAAGSIISQMAGGALSGKGAFEFTPALNPMLSDVQSLARTVQTDPVKGMNELVNLAAQAFTGVNPQTFTDMVVAVADACNGDLGVAKEAMLLTMRVMQVPQSQLDQLYIDELGMTAKEAQKMSPQAMAKRYANYRLNRNTPLTGWAYSEEERAKKIKSGEKRFNKLVKERTELHKNK